jgi:hypothetical protein
LIIINVLRRKCYKRIKIVLRKRVNKRERGSKRKRIAMKRKKRVN